MHFLFTLILSRKINKNCSLYTHKIHFKRLIIDFLSILPPKTSIFSRIFDNFTPMKETLQKLKTSLSPLYSQGEIKSLTKIIFEHLLNYSQVDIIMHESDTLSDFIKGKIDKVIERLLTKEPIQYIFNDAYFQGLHLKVTPHTLIPRPETEQLVDIIVKENPQQDLRVLDIGTGSGAIAISLARSLHFPIVDAFDISKEALEVATENAKTLKTKVNFFHKDILTEPTPAQPLYDIIVSNPPYITETERDDMEANVLDYEPHLALFVPNEDPLRFYRAIAIYASKALTPGGRIYFEINQNFGKETADLLTQNCFEKALVIKDMYGLDRFVSATKISER